MCVENTQVKPVERRQSNVKRSSKKTGLKPFKTTLHLDPFKVETQLVDRAVCGGFDGEFRTEVSITVDELDENGYVIHNEGFIGSVREAFRYDTFKASCEELAAGVAHIATQMVDRRLSSVKVKVYNLTGHAEVLWARGMYIPPFPRIATDAELRSTAGAVESRRC